LLYVLLCRGKGVSVVPQQEALSQALTHKHEPFSTSGSTDSDSVAYHNVLVQSYLQQQLVIAGQKMQFSHFIVLLFGWEAGCVAASTPASST
jgi:hypothetical protein